MQLSLITDQESQKTRGRGACEGVAELVALVEDMAARRCSVRQVLEAVRAFSERQAIPVAANSIWLAHDTPEWRAWAAYRGKSPPMDQRGGWRFPSRWPPVGGAGEQGTT
jgi:hypothetical protein